MPYKVKPTPKQKKAINLIREGKRPVEAMRAAGYSKETSDAPTQNLLSAAGSQAYLEELRKQYRAVGITPEFFGDKMFEWLSASKTDHSITEPDKVVPDYQTQLKAAAMVRQDWGLGQPIEVNNTQQNNFFLNDADLNRLA